jgi:hypothetical protein
MFSPTEGGYLRTSGRKVLMPGRSILALFYRAMTFKGGFKGTPNNWFFGEIEDLERRY